MHERIVILGGGIAALTTAFELTSQPGWQRRRAITVYQMGHRLGGKGASGRNAQRHDRIEEHGLHLFYGFYDNAFGLMRRCYAELDRPAGAPLATLEEAFKPHSLVVFEEQRRGAWQHQPLLFPRNAEAPGAGTPAPTLSELVPRMLRYLVTLYEEQIALRTRAETFRDLGLSEDEWNALTAGPTRDLVVLRLLCGAATALADEVGAALGRRGPGPKVGWRGELLGRLVAWSSRARAFVSPLLDESPSERLAWTAADLTLTMIRGMIADGLVDRDHVDWSALDHEDFRAWLRRHGGSEDAVRAATVVGVYAGAYAKEREIGAGTALHWTLRMLFTYRSALFYKMQAGMGDVVFAPLYQVLRRRGVRFRFFHRLDRLRLSADRARVAAVELGRQLLPRAGEYEPLVDVKGLPCWPSEPLYEQLDDGEALRASGESLEDFGTRWQDRGGTLTLRAGEDFDRVVLGIGLGAVPTVCQELIEDQANPRFARMLRSIQTTQTASVQLWLAPDLRATGWRLPPPVLIPYADPLDTWCDMSNLLPRESFPAASAPGSVAYLTAAMADDTPPPQTREEARDHGKRQHARLQEFAAQFLRESAPHLWPSVSSSAGLDLQRLWSDQASSGEERLRWQHFSPMHHPSDRYVLSVRGSTRDRLSAEDSGYENLTLCGDWIMNPMNLGCVEGATMSGMQAARALGADLVIHDDWLLACRPRPATPPQPRYIERQLNESTSPPYEARGVAMYSALLPADPERLRTLIDSHLNLGGERVYLPLGPFALFYAQNTRALSSSDAPGHVPEQDFGFMIPLAVCERHHGRLEARGVAVHVPFLWVDLGAAIYGGREVHGFPKGLAKLDFPSDPEGDIALRVTSVLPPRGPSNKGAALWREETLVEATLARSSQPASRGVPLSQMLGAREGMSWLRRAGLDRAEQLTLVRALGRTLRSGSLPMVFLKQFRDAADPTRACYQAIVEATVARRGPIRRTVLLAGDLSVAVHRESGIAQALGLRATAESTTRITTRAIAAVYTELEFTLGPGAVIWSASPHVVSRITRSASGYSP